MSLHYYAEEEDINKDISINNFYYLFSMYEPNLPTLTDALNQLFGSCCNNKKEIDLLVKDILHKCHDKIDKQFIKIKEKYNNITIEDAYIICSYTCESLNRKYSPYRVLNTNLVSENREMGIDRISKYLYILLKSLRKLDRFIPPEKSLYRCITRKVIEKDSSNENSISYKKGEKKKFWAFTSTSPNAKISYRFLEKEKNEKIKGGTIFILGGDAWGYDITLFNKYEEEEILMEPERQYIIEEIMPEVKDLIYIKCNIVQTPLVLDSFNIIEKRNIMKNRYNSDINLYKYICRIEMEIKIDNKGKYISGVGFLCNILFKNMKVLITYNHVINFDFLNNEKKLIYKNYDDKIREIDMKVNRYKYTNKELNITIIEILENEENEENYLEIDDYINTKNYNEEEIYFVGYNTKKKNYYNYQGRIKEKKNDYFICNNNVSVGGGFIILKENLKLLGIIKENETTITKTIIPMNILLIKMNYIKCIYEIKKEDMRKEIQLLNNNDGNLVVNSEIEDKIKIIINGEFKSKILKYKFNKEGLHTIYIVAEKLLTNMAYMFSKCFYLKEIDLSSFNSANIYNISNIFSSCSRLAKINFSSFNTTKITDMSYMFYGCSKLEELNLKEFNTTKVVDMSYMFCECSELEKLNLSSFCTTKVTDMSYMFFGCSRLKELNLILFDTKNVKNMSYMFLKCTGLKELDLTSFNTNQVTNMTYMFFGCSGLKQLDLSNFNTNKVTNMSYIFTKCSGLKQLNI